MLYRLVEEIVPEFIYTCHAIKWLAKDYKKDTFKFVQIGANDGKMHDPIHYYIKKYNWEGILIEPVPYYFEGLKTTYKNHSKLTLVNQAIGDERGEKTIYYVDPQKNDVAGWFQGLASFDRANLVKHKRALPDIEKHIREQKVKTLALKELMDQHNVERIDLLCLDVEGFEYNIIKQLPQLAITPRMILYEHVHLNSATKKLIDAQLKKKGYRFRRMLSNTLAYQSN